MKCLTKYSLRLPRRTPKALLEAKLSASGCLEVKVPPSHEYGAIKVKGRLIKAHRVAWMIHRGAIPDGMFVCHRCDNPKCVNLDHLFLGTPADNHRDCVSKGRNHRTIGELAYTAKLNAGKVREISERLKREPSKALALEFGVSVDTIRRIAKRQTWKHLWSTSSTN